MIVYVDTKNGKVDLTKDELKKLLKEEYDRGYNAGKKVLGSVTYSCPNYWGCPYRYCNSWTVTTANGYTFDSNQVTCNNSDSKTITLNNSTISPINPISNETGTITFKEK